MTVTTQGESMEARLATLEQRVEETASRLERHLLGQTTLPVAPPSPHAATAATPLQVAVPARPPRGQGRAGTGRLSLGDLIGGRVLAWLGGAATLLGIVLFLALAISRGWIGVEARVGLAALASGALMAGGIWLHARHGRTEVSVALVGVATAGLFATLIVAGEIYHLIAPLLALCAAMLVGALAAILAIRWAGQAIAVLGLLGALLSPVMLDVPSSGLTVAMLGVASGCAVWAAIAQRWGWLAPAALALCAPQWGAWILHDQPVAADLAVLVWFGGLGLLGNVAAQRGFGQTRLSSVAAGWTVLSAAILALVGYGALSDAAGAVWLGSWAAVHLAAGFWSRRWLPVPPALVRVMEALGLAVVAYLSAQLFAGADLVVTWAAEGVVVCELARRAPESNRHHEQLAWYGALGFLGLAVAHALAIEAPPAALVRGTDSLPDAALALGAVAVALLRAAQMRLPGDRLRLWLRSGSAAAVLYLGSVAIITASQPSSGAFADTLLSLSTRQQGQVLLSACWSGAGLIGLIVGLRRDQQQVRTVALALLLISVAKVFLYDLSTLTSVYRVISFVALGLLLLAGAYAHQRLRPPPPETGVPG